MLAEKTYNSHTAAEGTISLSAKMRDMAQLVKLRLNLLVVFSTFIGYMLGVSFTSAFSWIHLIALLSGGFLVVGAANGLNQVIEKDLDKLMKRTSNRPVASNRMGVTEAVVTSFIMGVAGIVFIAYFLNPLSAFIAFISLILYAFVYTPMKRISPVAVFIGAIPGALPPLIGYTAATGMIDATAGLLFLIQFIWQFPHFWAIAWVLHDDYKLAGFKLLPMGSNRDHTGALHILMYTVLLLPISILPYKLGIISIYGSSVMIIASLVFLWQAWNLYKKLSISSAKGLMFGSFFYLPIVMIVFLIDKLFL